MNPSPELRELLAELRRVKSPVARLRLVAGAYRAIREMSPEERRHLAEAVGIRGADRLVERLGFGQGELSPTELMRALQQKDEDEGATVERIVDQLRSRDGRRELARQGMEVLEKRFAPPAAEPLILEEPAPRAEASAADAGVAPLAVPPPSAPPRSLAPPAMQAAPVPPLAAPPPGKGASSPLPQAAAPPRRPQALAAGEELAKDLASTPRLLVRFRLLNRRAPALQGAGPELLRRVLLGFPDGWPRRRALTALIRASVVDIPGELAALAETLARTADRRWCEKQGAGYRSTETRAR